MKRLFVFVFILALVLSPFKMLAASKNNDTKAFKIVFSIFNSKNEFLYANLQKRWIAKLYLQSLLSKSWQQMNADKKKQVIQTAKARSIKDFEKKYLDDYPELENGTSDQLFFMNLSAKEIWQTRWDVDYTLFKHKLL